MESEVRASEPMQTRRKLPDTRPSMSHTFVIVTGLEKTLEVTIHVGLYEETRMPGEIFVEIPQNSSTLGALVDSWAIMVSMSLQYGTPLEAIVKKFAFTRFEPSGFTTNQKIRRAHSILDYVARWMGHTFIPNYNGEST